MADPGADTSGGYGGVDSSDVDTGFGDYEGISGNNPGFSGPGRTEADRDADAGGRFGFSDSGLPDQGGWKAKVKSWIEQNLPNFNTTVKAALAVVATALAPEVGIPAAAKLAYNNYKGRMDAKVKSGMTPDEAWADMEKEYKDWESNFPNLESKGSDEIINSLPGGSDGTETTGAETPVTSSTAYDPTAPVGTPITDQYRNQYNPTQNALLDSGITMNKTYNFGNSSPEEIVSSLYQTALGREASPEEVAQWANSGLGVDEIVKQIQGSPEAQQYQTNNSQSQNALLGINDDLWGMYDKGYGDITGARDAGIADINAAVEQGRGDIQGMYETGTGYYQPYREAGTRALGTLEERLAAGPGEFEESPGYQFRLGEGIKTMERAASARGGAGALYDPRLYNELQQYGQGYASDEYDKFINRYYQSLTPYQQMVQNVGLPAAGASADLAYNTGIAKSNLGMSGATQNALLRTNAAQQTAGLGFDTARTATTNVLDKERIGTDWGKLALLESEGEKGRQFTGSESALDRGLSREMADKGIAYSNDVNDKNNDANFWNNVIKTGGYLWSNW